MTSLLLQTIETDLAAGESWLETEVETVGLNLWNILKGAFVALGPSVGQLVIDTLSAATTAANAGMTIEQVETSALNTAAGEAKAALVTAGSGVVQTIIAGIRATTPAAS